MFIKKIIDRHYKAERNGGNSAACKTVKSNSDITEEARENVWYNVTSCNLIIKVKWIVLLQEQLWHKEKEMLYRQVMNKD